MTVVLIKFVQTGGNGILETKKQMCEMRGVGNERKCMMEKERRKQNTIQRQKRMLIDLSYRKIKRENR